MKRLLALSLALANLLTGGLVLAEINGETLAQFVQRVSADAETNGQLGRICALRGIAAVGAKVTYRRDDGNGQIDCDGNRRYDCSGYVLGVASPVVRIADPSNPRPSAAGIHDYMARFGAAKDLAGSGGSYEPEPGDLVFFHPHDGRGVSHVGFYLGRGRFIHVSGADGTPIHISSLDEHASRKGSADAYTWRDDLVGYGDLSRMPLRSPAERAQLAAANPSRDVQAGPGVVGGVYISPAFILDAIRSDSTGALDALEDQISRMDFDENPVQELPDLAPPDGFSPGAARARIEGSPAFRELLGGR